MIKRFRFSILRKHLQSKTVSSTKPSTSQIHKEAYATNAMIHKQNRIAQADMAQLRDFTSSRQKLTSLLSLPPFHQNLILR